MAFTERTLSEIVHPCEHCGEPCIGQFCSRRCYNADRHMRQKLGKAIVDAMSAEERRQAMELFRQSGKVVAEWAA